MDVFYAALAKEAVPGSSLQHWVASQGRGIIRDAALPMRGHNQAGHHAPEELAILSVGDRSQDRRHLHEPDPFGGVERGRAVRIPGRAAEAPGGGASATGALDALVLSGTGGFGLIGAQSWAFWLEWWTLRGAKSRISAHDAQVRQGYRKDTEEKTADAACGGVNAECPTSCPSRSYRSIVGRHPRRSAPGAFSIRQPYRKWFLMTIS